MQKRLLLGIVCALVALLIMLARYVPSQGIVRNIADPAAATLLAGYGPAAFDGTMLARPAGQSSTIRVPLLDSRGALRVALRLRSTAALSLTVGSQALRLPHIPQYRTIEVLAPPRGGRELLLGLAAPTADSVAVAGFAATGRGGWPPLSDLVALALLASVPALLLVLTIRLPLDWALAASMGVVALLGLLPATDRGALLSFGPLVVLIVGGVAALAPARDHPGAALVLLFGAALRGYALGWGGGYAFAAAEQALLNGTAADPLARLVYGSAWLLHAISGNAGWTSGWGYVLVGRAWALAAGVALIVAVYALGLLLLRRRWALLAAGLTACVPVLVQQSHMTGAAAWLALLAILVVLLATYALVARAMWAALSSLVVGALLAALAPALAGWLAAPLVALAAGPWRRSAPARAAALVTMLVAGALILIRGVAALPAVGAGAAGVDPVSARLPYVYPLFNMLLWGMGPLLMQLGIVGWALGLVLSLHERRERRWLPLLLGGALAFAVAGRGPVFALDELAALVPLLCLAAALLLQIFSQRLRFAFGQRTVRLLACTALGLALVSSVGLLNIYRGPDVRLQAASWLVAQSGPGDMVLYDSAAALPPGLPAAIAHMPLSADATGDAVQRSAAALARGRFLITTGAADAAAPERLMLAPAERCFYAALSAGRLGYVRRASFGSAPHIGRWTLDDRAADAAMRAADHPRLVVFERAGPYDAATIARGLRCSAP